MKSMPLLPKCQIESCENRARSGKNRYCEKHYYRIRRTGSPEARVRSYSFNEDRFSVIDEDSAWVLGLLWTDGCLKGNGIDYATVDRQMMDDFNDVMGGIGCVKFYKKEPPHSDVFRWNGCSKVTSSDLRSYGMHESKSFSIDWPVGLPDDMRGHFFRGVFDGDGCFFATKNNQGRLSIATASEKFANSIVENMGITGVSFRPYRSRGKSAISVSCIRRADIERLHSIMYPCEIVRCLKRKRDKLERFIQTPRAPVGRSPRIFVNITGEKRETVRALSELSGVRKDTIRSRIAAGEPIGLNLIRETLKKEKDLTGADFGTLVAKNRTKNSTYYWDCECSCGLTKKVRQDHLISGRTMSCGKWKCRRLAKTLRSCLKYAVPEN